MADEIVHVNKEIYRGVYVTKRIDALGYTHTRYVYSRGYSKPGPAKGWITSHTSRGTVKGFHDSWVESSSDWSRLD